MSPPPDKPTIMPTRTVEEVIAAEPVKSAPGAGNTLPMGTRLGEFEITGLVGEGGFGIVYLAHDHSLQRNVALKEYMPSALAARSQGMMVGVRSARDAETFQAGLRSFINEARLLAQFDHPSLVKVYRFWEANGTAYMVMPFYEGITLKGMLRNLGGRPDEDWLKDLLQPLTDALALIHKEQCFHRDIAPDNILILNGGRPLLLDFGAARRVIGDMTHGLTAILKPGYAPVEQYAEAPSMKQGAWTDIYALASVVYYAIVGKAPMPSVGRLISDPLEPLAKTAAGRYSAEFLQGIDKALSVKPGDRPQSITELRILIGLGDRRHRARSPLPEAAPDTSAAPGSAPMATVPASGQTAPVPTGGAVSVPAEAQPGSGPTPDLQATIRHDERKTATGPLFVVAALLIVLVGAAGYFVLHGTRREAPIAAARPASPLAVPNGLGEPTPAAEPSVPPVTAPAAKPPFSPALMLSQVLEGRDRQHAVTVSVDKAQVRIGLDQLRFSVSSAKSGYLYILGLGTRDSDFQLLFPNTLDRNNHLEPGQLLKLPGSRWSLPAHGPAGTNQFVAIVSDEPHDFTDLGTQPEDVFQRFPLEVGARLFRDYAGETPLYAGQVRCARPGACSQSYGAAIFSIEEIASGPAEAELPEAPAAEPSRAKSTNATALAKRVPRRANANPSTTMEAKPDCSDILQRASLGETLSSREQTILKRDCR